MRGDKMRIADFYLNGETTAMNDDNSNRDDACDGIQRSPGSKL